MGDAKTIKISGQADVKQVIADLDKITEKAAALNVPGASGRSRRSSRRSRSRRPTAAIKGADGHGLHRRAGQVLRRLTVNADLKDAASKIDAGVLLDLTFTKVAQKQTFTAPSNPKPFRSC